MRKRLFILLLLFHLHIWLAEGLSIWDDYEECRREGFANGTVLVCDADNVLANSTKVKLTKLLKDLQTRISCQCKDGACMRSDGNDKYMGILVVSNTQKVNATSKTLNETANDIYKNAELGTADCHNGLLIIYNKDQKQLATYQGPGSFHVLRPEDMAKLHNLAAKGDDTALQYLLSNYENVMMRSEIQRAETWTPMIGLSIALIIVLLILALLLALFMARFCCCCARKQKQTKKETYQLTPMTATFKTMEQPFYTTTLPHPPPPQLHTERVMHPALSHGDAIYSTPYSGTPLPPPHLGGATRADIYSGGSLRSATASQSATPVSSHRHRIRPVQTQIPRGLTPAATPTLRSRQSSQRVDDFTQNEKSELQTNEPSTPPAGGSGMPMQRNSSASITQAVVPRSTHDTSSVQRSVGYAESDLSFLDPRRKLEVQTRTDYIY